MNDKEADEHKNNYVDFRTLPFCNFFYKILKRSCKLPQLIIIDIQKCNDLWKTIFWNSKYYGNRYTQFSNSIKHVLNAIPIYYDIKFQFDTKTCSGVQQ